MSHILQNHDYDLILHDKGNLQQLFHGCDIRYNITSQLISYVESVRKRANHISYKELKKFIQKLSSGFFPQIGDINLTSSDIGNALNDQQFSEEEIGNHQNPYVLSSIIAVKYRNEDEIWWDPEEILKELYKIRNGNI